MEWNLRRRLDAARSDRKDKADVERAEPSTAGLPVPNGVIELDSVSDGTQPTATARPVMDYRTVRSVRETQAAQRRERALAEAEAAAQAARPAPVIPLTGQPSVSSPSADGAPATVSTIMRQAITDPQPIITTRPAQERCPNCGGSVRIDMFDLVQAVAHLSCLDCGFIYTAKSPNI